MTATAPAILIEDVASGYYGKKVLDGISFTISEPGVYIVLGPNGAGKTTLLRTLAGILKPYTGRVEINGIPSLQREARRQIDYITHLDGIPEGMNVHDGLRFYADVEGGSEGDVERVIGLLDLKDLAGMRFTQLSQGQKKRVSVARIFLREKSVYLLDEPTSNLDPKVAREIRELVLQLSKDKVVLYSSHNLFEAREIGNRVIAVKGGRLALFGRIDEIRTQTYTIGVRTIAPEASLESGKKEGEYYLFDLKGPEEVPALISGLIDRGVKIREVREMQNPLEELFK
ncbi:MAG TPA: heme ABC exporter ATP-binding protein CcmA [Nitrososphaerales archaeon]|nr:heme ABC exporter ATP-binding protein CcmA [Nitrososphaerales archaeon]